MRNLLGNTCNLSRINKKESKYYLCHRNISIFNNIEDGDGDRQYSEK